MKNCFFLCFVLLFTGCGSNFFTIQLKNKEYYDQIQALMYEIYQNAKDGNTNYFRAAIEREYNYDEQIEYYKARYGDNYEIKYYNALYDREVLQVCEDLMGQIVKSKIYITELF